MAQRGADGVLLRSQDKKDFHERERPPPASSESPPKAGRVQVLASERVTDTDPRSYHQSNLFGFIFYRCEMMGFFLVGILSRNLARDSNAIIVRVDICLL